MLTIGQLAACAGVTVRAVRHYHAKGLLPEPERDASGYRSYDAAAVVGALLSVTAIFGEELAGDDGLRELLTERLAMLAADGAERTARRLAGRAAPPPATIDAHAR